MKNFTCPNCKAAATLKDIVPNKKLREIISWFKELTNDNTINIQNQNVNQPNPFSALNNNYLSNLKGFVSSKPKESQVPVVSGEATKPVVFSKESIIDEKLNLLKSQTAARSGLTPTAKEKLAFSFNNPTSDEKGKYISGNIKAINPNNMFGSNNNNISNTESANVYNTNLHNLNPNIPGGINQSFQDANLYNGKIKESSGVRKESVDNIQKIRISDKINVNASNEQNDINKIEFKKESNMTPEEKMQLYNKINSDSSVSGSLRKQSEEVNESVSQKGTTGKYIYMLFVYLKFF